MENLETAYINKDVKRLRTVVARKIVDSIYLCENVYDSCDAVAFLRSPKTKFNEHWNRYDCSHTVKLVDNIIWWEGSSSKEWTVEFDNASSAREFWNMLFQEHKMPLEWVSSPETLKEAQSLRECAAWTIEDSINTYVEYLKSKGEDIPSREELVKKFELIG